MTRCKSYRPLAALTFLMLLILGASLPTDLARAATPFTDTQGRFTFVPPDGFALYTRDSYDGYINFRNNDQKAYFDFYVYKFTSNSLDDLVGQRYTFAMQQKGYEFPSGGGIQTTTLDGHDARQYEHYTTANDGTRYHWLTIFTYAGNVLGRVDFATPEDIWATLSPTMAASLDSYHLLMNMYPTTFVNTAKKFSVPLVNNWQRDLSLSSTDGTSDVLTISGPSVSIYASALPIARGISVDKIAAEEIIAKPSQDMTTESSQMMAQPGTLGGQPALQWDYFNTAANVRYHHRLFWAVSGTTRYRLSINARDTDWDSALMLAQPLVDGFTFGSPTGM